MGEGDRDRAAGQATEGALPGPARLSSERRHGLGLRAQIMVALGIGFAASVLLLGLTTAQLGRRAIDADRRRAAGATAEALLALSDSSPDAWRQAAEALVDTEGIAGVELRTAGVSARVGRLAEGGPTVERRRGSRTVRLALAPPAAGPRRSLSGLLFLYVGVTAAAILLLTYVLLTRLIVRPVEELTRATERLARGGGVRAPVRGAAEVARLALSFNETQAQLFAERQALRARLEELERTTSELAAAERSLIRSEKLASVGRLAAGIAHEIGNPLTSIAGLVELVEEGGLEPEEQREFLRRVRRETDRIHTIIRDLLDFARAEPGTDEASASCDLVDVVEDAVRLVGPQKDLRHVNLERRFDPEAAPVVGSASRLSQVVLNLLLNAADAIEGEGTIRLEVRPSERAGFVELGVADTGPGIPPDVREHIFEPFVTSKPPGEGTGLGLAVCHNLVEQLGGTLEAWDEPEGGARFVVTLPAA